MKTTRRQAEKLTRSDRYDELLEACVQGDKTAADEVLSALVALYPDATIDDLRDDCGHYEARCFL